MRLFGLSLIALTLLSGCATVFEGPNQDLAIRTAPVGASCSLEREGELLGVVPSTPGSVFIHRSPRDIVVWCQKTGWRLTSQTVESKFNGTTISNILLPGVLTVAAGVIADASTGANHSYDPPPYILMRPLPLEGEAEDGFAPRAPISVDQPQTSAPPKPVNQPAIALK